MAGLRQYSKPSTDLIDRDSKLQEKKNFVQAEYTSTYSHLTLVLERNREIKCEKWEGAVYYVELSF